MVSTRVVHRGTTQVQVMLRNTSQQRQDNKKNNQNLHLGADNAADAGATWQECEVARCVTLGREFQQKKKNNVNRKKKLTWHAGR